MDSQNSNCFKIEKTDLCPGFESLYASKVEYTDSNEFDSVLKDKIKNVETILLNACPNSVLNKVSYATSYNCNIVISEKLNRCIENTNIPKLLCKSTCQKYLEGLIQNNNQYNCQDTYIGGVQLTCDSLPETNCISGNPEEISFSGYKKSVYCEMDPTKEVCTGNFNSTTIGNDGSVTNSSPTTIDEDLELENSDSSSGGGLTTFIIIILIVAVVGVLGLIIYNKKHQKKMMLKNKSNEDIMMDSMDQGQSNQNFILAMNENIMDRNQNMLSNTSTTLPTALPLLSLNSKEDSSTSNKIRAESISLFQGSTIAPDSPSLPVALENVYMTVVYQYNATLDDELTLHKNDRIKVEHEYDDGWGAGVNMNTGEYGAFPIVCCKYEDKNEDKKLSLLKLPEEIEEDMKKSTIFSTVPKRLSSVSFLDGHNSIRQKGSRTESIKHDITINSELHNRISTTININTGSDSHLQQIDENNVILSTSTSASTSENGSKDDIYSPKQTLIKHDKKN